MDASRYGIVDPYPARLVHSAKAASMAEGRALMETLAALCGDDEDTFLRRLGATVGYLSVDEEWLSSANADFSVIPFNECMRRVVVVIKPASEELEGEGDNLVVTADPFDMETHDWIAGRMRSVSWSVARREDLLTLLARHEDEQRALDFQLQTAATAPLQAANNISLSSIIGDQNPVVKLVNSTLYDAMKLTASDIHIEAVTTGLRIRYRIDGVLSQATIFQSRTTAEQVVSRIKVMADLDIAERRVPQDGRFKQMVRGVEIDYRVSIMPSLHGEDVVIRILDKRALADQFQSLRLERLGFDPTTLDWIRGLVRVPYGMLLVTGPTGSGKTTTLYAALSELDSTLEKIVTIEDPVEYQLPGILQIPVNEKKGLTFAKGLRSILRHDPDKILVGEIRDTETAQIAIQSALTGHLVLTSVHANNVFDVLGRFIHMGVDTQTFVSAMNGVVAQRLVRLACTNCKQAWSPDDKTLARSGITKSDADSMQFVRCGAGCRECRGTGYSGRSAIGEVLRMSDELRDMIVSRRSIRQIKAFAREQGSQFLRHAAVNLAARGYTTLEEIDRVTFVD